MFSAVRGLLHSNARNGLLISPYRTRGQISRVQAGHGTGSRAVAAAYYMRCKGIAAYSRSKTCKQETRDNRGIVLTIVAIQTTIGRKQAYDNAYVKTNKHTLTTPISLFISCCSFSYAVWPTPRVLADRTAYCSTLCRLVQYTTHAERCGSSFMH